MARVASSWWMHGPRRALKLALGRATGSIAVFSVVAAGPMTFQKHESKGDVLQPSGKLNYSFAFECPAPRPPDFKVEPKICVSAQIETNKKKSQL